MLIIPHDPFTPAVKNHFSPRLTILALSPLNSGDYRTTRAWTDFCLSPSNFLPLSSSLSPSIDHSFLSRALFAPQSIILGDSFPLFSSPSPPFSTGARARWKFSFFNDRGTRASARELAVWQAEFSKSRDAISDSCLPVRGGVSANSVLSLSLFFSASAGVPVFQVGLFRKLTSPRLAASCANSWDFRRYVGCSRPLATIRL